VQGSPHRNRPILRERGRDYGTGVRNLTRTERTKEISRKKAGGLNCRGDINLRTGEIGEIFLMKGGDEDRGPAVELERRRAIG